MPAEHSQPYANRRLKPGDTFGQGGLETQLTPRVTANSAGIALRLLALFVVVLLLTVMLLVIAGQRGRQNAQGWTWDDAITYAKAIA